MTDLTYRRYELEDGNGHPIRFEGQLLADVSSQNNDESKDRWTEIRIYRTQGGSFILERVGQTRLPGELVKARAKVIGTPAELLDGLQILDEHGVKYLTLIARDAFFDAMETCEELRLAWDAIGQEVA